MLLICQQLPWGTLSERDLQTLDSNVMKATLDVFSLTCWLQTPFECRSAESPVADPTLFLALVWLSIITEFLIYRKSNYEFRFVLCTEFWFWVHIFLGRLSPVSMQWSNSLYLSCDLQLGSWSDIWSNIYTSPCMPLGFAPVTWTPNSELGVHEYSVAYIACAIRNPESFIFLVEMVK